MRTSPGPTREAAVWTARDAAVLYGLEAWGGGYFGVSGRGTVVAHPHGSPEQAIDLLEVVRGLEARDLVSPMVLRFDDILAHRMGHLLSLIHISEPTRPMKESRMPSSA